MTPLARTIREIILREGPITFARFMELALYAPGLGYYEQRRKIGREGDFYTSVSVGPLFGQLLAFEFARWMDETCPVGAIQWAEAGAHDGRLAADMLGWLGRWRPDILSRLEYIILESSEARRGWQRETLARWPQVKWSAECPEVTGVIFSNEFFDALPVHRLGWKARDQVWQEWRVGVEGGGFGWRFAPTDLGPRLPAELAGVLPDGFILEVCPAAVAWWRKSAGALRRGKIVAIDYGLSGEERLRPQHAHGALRTFARHHGGADLLGAPGEQDITADVDFSALQKAGEEAGLTTEGLALQAQFLTRIAARKPPPEEWDTKRVRQFQTLTHPEHLGRRFRVFIQSRAGGAR